MRVLVVNAGSSSLKVRLIDGDDQLEASNDLAAEGGHVDAGALGDALAAMGPADAVGHRVVHGGADFTEAVVLTEDVRGRLEALVELAPLHQPAALAGMEAVEAHRPGLPGVACFDTAFHAGLPPAAHTVALPAAWRRRFRLRRYGFHGLSHQWASHRAAELLQRPLAELRLVTCHLGAGCSLAAVDGGRSVDTTMGFTPVDGLVMATRAGSIDPGLLLWLQREAGIAVDELADAIEHGSGLKALAGTPDMAAIVDASARGDVDATLALDVFVHRATSSAAAMTAAMGGLDGLVFTGGMGEHAPVVRSRVVAGLGFLGAAMDEAANQAADGDTVISPPGIAAPVMVVEAREDLQIAQEVRRILL